MEGNFVFLVLSLLAIQGRGKTVGHADGREDSSRPHGDTALSPDQEAVLKGRAPVSKGDAAKCPGMTCLNNGFVGQDCKCKCPENTEGVRCETVRGNSFRDVPKCGGTITREGEISTFIDSHSAIDKCVFSIVAPKCKRPSITFTHVKFYGKDCNENRLTTKLSSRHLWVTYCKEEDVPTGIAMVADKNQATVYYSTGYWGSKKYGIKADVKFVDDPECGGHAATMETTKQSTGTTTKPSTILTSTSTSTVSISRNTTSTTTTSYTPITSTISTTTSTRTSSTITTTTKSKTESTMTSTRTSSTITTTTTSKTESTTISTRTPSTITTTTSKTESTTTTSTPFKTSTTTTLATSTTGKSDICRLQETGNNSFVFGTADGPIPPGSSCSLFKNITELGELVYSDVSMNLSSGSGNKITLNCANRIYVMDGFSTYVTLRCIWPFNLRYFSLRTPGKGFSVSFSPVRTGPNYCRGTTIKIQPPLRFKLLNPLVGPTEDTLECAFRIEAPEGKKIRTTVQNIPTVQEERLQVKKSYQFNEAFNDIEPSFVSENRSIVLLYFAVEHPVTPWVALFEVI